MTSGEGSVQRISRVKLHSRLRRHHCQCPAALRLRHESHLTQSSGLSVKNPVVVIAVRKGSLPVVTINALADCMRRTEVHRRTLHAANLAGGNQRTVRRGEGLSMKH